MTCQPIKYMRDIRMHTNKKNEILTVWPMITNQSKLNTLHLVASAASSLSEQFNEKICL